MSPRTRRRLAVGVVLGELAAARVAPPAHLDLTHRPRRWAPDRIARLRADRPGDAPAIVQREGEPLRATVKTLPVAFLAGPRDVVRAGPVAGLTGDVDLGVGGIEGAALGIVVLPDAG